MKRYIHLLGMLFFFGFVALTALGIEYLIGAWGIQPAAFFIALILNGITFFLLLPMMED